MNEGVVVGETVVCLRPCSGLKALFPKSSLFVALLQSSLLLLDASRNNKAILKVALPHDVSVVDCTFLPGVECFVLATSDSSVMVVPVEQGQLEDGGGSGVIQGENIARKKWRSQPRMLKPVQYPIESNSTSSEAPRSALVMVSCDDGSLAVVSIGSEINGLTCPCPAASFKNSLGAPSTVLSVSFASHDVMVVAYGFDESSKGNNKSSNGNGNGNGNGNRTRRAKDKQPKNLSSTSSTPNTTPSYGGVSLTAWRLTASFGSNGTSGASWFDYTAGKESGALQKAVHLYTHRIASNATLKALVGGVHSVSTLVMPQTDTDTGVNDGAIGSTSSRTWIVWEKRAVATGFVSLSTRLDVPGLTAYDPPSFPAYHHYQSSTTHPTASSASSTSIGESGAKKEEVGLWLGDIAFSTRYGVRMSAETAAVGTALLSDAEGANKASEEGREGSGDDLMLVLPGDEERDSHPGYCVLSRNAAISGSAVISATPLPLIKPGGATLLDVLGTRRPSVDTSTTLPATGSSSAAKAGKGVLASMEQAEKKEFTALLAQRQKGGGFKNMATEQASSGQRGAGKVPTRLMDSFLNAFEAAPADPAYILASDWEALIAILSSGTISQRRNSSMFSQIVACRRLDVLSMYARWCCDLSERKAVECLNAAIDICHEALAKEMGDGTDDPLSARATKGTQKGRTNGRKGKKESAPAAPAYDAAATFLAPLPLPLTINSRGHLKWGTQEADDGQGGKAERSRRVTSLSCLLAVCVAVLLRKESFSAMTLADSVKAHLSPNAAMLTFRVYSLLTASLHGVDSSDSTTEDDEGAFLRTVVDNLKESHLQRAIVWQDAIAEGHFGSFSIYDHHSIPGVTGSTDEANHGRGGRLLHLKRKREAVEDSQSHVRMTEAALGYVKHTERMRKVRREQEMLQSVGNGGNRRPEHTKWGQGVALGGKLLPAPSGLYRYEQLAL